VTGNPLFLGLALMGFFLNLFNMMPVYPLDGGWITGAISPYIWIVGLVAIIGLGLTGYMTNPFIWVLLIMSLPRMVNALKRGTLDTAGKITTPAQRATIGLAYVSLCGVLLWGMAETSRGSHVIRSVRHSRLAPAVQ